MDFTATYYWLLFAVTREYGFKYMHFNCIMSHHAVVSYNKKQKVNIQLIDRIGLFAKWSALCFIFILHLWKQHSLRFRHSSNNRLTVLVDQLLIYKFSCSRFIVCSMRWKASAILALLLLAPWNWHVNAMV